MDLLVLDTVVQNISFPTVQGGGATYHNITGAQKSGWFNNVNGQHSFIHDFYLEVIYEHECYINTR